MVEYGSGPGLDQYLDFQIDQTGDVGSSYGVNELEKDLSFNVIRALEYGEGFDTPSYLAGSGVVGEPISDGLLSDIESIVAKVIDPDPRIAAVQNVSATAAPDEDDYIEIDCDVRVDTGDVSFTFVIPAN